MKIRIDTDPVSPTKCDFCGCDVSGVCSLAVYDARPSNVPMVDADSGSVFMYCDDGKWFCCSICEPLVDQKDHGALLERATDMYRELTKKPTTDGIILRLSQCHAIFFAHAGAAGYN